MIGLILIVLFWIFTTVMALQCGAEIVAINLHKKHKISDSEFDELVSLKFLFKSIRE